MNKILIAFAFAFYAPQVLAQDPSLSPLAQSACAPYKNQKLAIAADAMCKRGLIKAFAALVNQTFNLPKSITVVGAECGMKNAYYISEKAVIVICYELGLDIFERVAREIKADSDTRGQIASGAIMFIFFHELGHAAIDLYQIPVLGREEDAADQIGVLMMMAMVDARPDVAINWPIGAHWFFDKRQSIFTAHNFADEHAIDAQRKFNLACWFYGSDPGKYLQLARYAKLPESRAVRCPGEFEKMKRAAGEMLSRHLKRTDHSQRQEGSGHSRSSMAERAATCQGDANLLGLTYPAREDFINNCYRVNGVTVSR